MKSKAQQQQQQQSKLTLASINMNTNGDKENGNETKEDNGMNQNGQPTRLHIPKFNHSRSPRQLKQEPRTQQHEQHHRNHHRPPICHNQ